MTGNDIEVSIVCTTYNQSKYIRKALDSFLMQKTNFPFEILVHDDCSTDGTTEILRDYESRYPKLIRVLYEEENQYSKYGLGCMKKIVYPKARGKYYATCEGDDFFTDERKLQTQYDILESHPELSMCACQAIVVGDDEAEVIDKVRPKENDCILTAQEVILGGGMYLATNSLFFKRELFMSEMEYEKVISFDYTSQIKGALHGGIYYIDQPMAAYRRYASGSWTSEVLKHPEQRLAHNKREMEMLRVLDKETLYQYHDAIEKRLTAYIPPVQQLRNHRDELLTKLAELKRPAFIWGLGVRGVAFEEFCKEVGIDITGVCDKRLNNFGDLDDYGYQIFSGDDILQSDASVIATNEKIAEFLVKQGFKGEIFCIEPYIIIGVVRS